MRRFDHTKESISEAIGYTGEEFDTIQDKIHQLGMSDGPISTKIEEITKLYTDPVDLIFAGMVIGGAIALSREHKKQKDQSLWNEFKKE